jgi:hypothetical protein
MADLGFILLSTRRLAMVEALSERLRGVKITC